MAASDVCICGHREHEHDGATRWCMHQAPAIGVYGGTNNPGPQCSCRTYTFRERVAGPREGEMLHAIIRLREQMRSGMSTGAISVEAQLLQLVELSALTDAINRLTDDGE